MKKLLVLMLAICMMIFTLSACDDTPADTGDSIDTPDTTESTDTTEATSDTMHCIPTVEIDYELTGNWSKDPESTISIYSDGSVYHNGEPVGADIYEDRGDIVIEFHGKMLIYMPDTQELYDADTFEYYYKDHEWGEYVQITVDNFAEYFEYNPLFTIHTDSDGNFKSGTLEHLYTLKAEYIDSFNEQMSTVTVYYNYNTTSCRYQIDPSTATYSLSNTESAGNGSGQTTSVSLTLTLATDTFWYTTEGTATVTEGIFVYAVSGWLYLK